MDLNTISFAEFIESELQRQQHTNRSIAELARISFRAIADARSGRLEEGLKSKIFTGRKLIGVTLSTRRLLIGLGADESFWMNRLGLDNTRADVRIPIRSSSFIHAHITKRIVGALDKPVSAGSIKKVFEKATLAQNALGDVFTAQTILSLLLQELEDQ